MTLEGIRIRLRNIYLRRTAAHRRKKLEHTDFTIISNNCWGGLIYESYGLEKQSPTVGMYFVAEEYLKFVSNLPHYLFACELTFVEPEQARHKTYYSKDKSFGQYPIAQLDDVEFAILHSHSRQEAKEKWERRCKRVNMDRLIVKMNDQNGCTREQAEAFMKLPYPHKLFFTAQGWQLGEGTVKVPGSHGAVATSMEPFGASGRLNVNKLINGLQEK